MTRVLLMALLALDLAASAFAQTSVEVVRRDFHRAVQSENWLQAAVARETARATVSVFAERRTSPVVQQQPRERRNWISRHPVLTGTLLGFGGGFLIGYLPGDDGVFYDFTAEFNGLVLGGAGAGIGAVVGAVVGR